MRFASAVANKADHGGVMGLRFPETQFTVGKMFQQVGYTTGYVGKRYLGTRMTTRDGGIQNSATTDFTKPVQVGTPQYGFDKSFILPGSLDMFPYVFARNNQWVGKVTTQKGWSAFNRTGPAAEDFVDHEVLDRFCDEAEAFISHQAKQNNPFFLFLSLTAPHTPTSPSPEFVGKSRIGIYGDFVMNTDACIGRIVSALEKAGITDRTMVMASSDHGPGHYSGKNPKALAYQLKDMEQDGHRANSPWRGYKFSLFEGGNRIPFAVKWPGMVKAGSVCSSLIGMNDLMATWAEMIGADLSEAQAPDSISFLPLLKNPNAPAPRRSMVVQGTHGNAFRDGEWKLLLCPGSGSSGPFATAPKFEDAWRQAMQSYGKSPTTHAELEQPPFLQLYHLAVDPEERTNLAAEEPNRVKEMIHSFRNTIAKGRSTPGPVLANDREMRVFHPVPKFV